MARLSSLRNFLLPPPTPLQAWAARQPNVVIAIGALMTFGVILVQGGSGVEAVAGALLTAVILFPVTRLNRWDLRRRYPSLLEQQREDRGREQ